jgi:hypothetical protein
MLFLVVQLTVVAHETSRSHAHFPSWSPMQPLDLHMLTLFVWPQFPAPTLFPCPQYPLSQPSLPDFLISDYQSVIPLLGHDNGSKSLSGSGSGSKEQKTLAFGHEKRDVYRLAIGRGYPVREAASVYGGTPIDPDSDSDFDKDKPNQTAHVPAHVDPFPALPCFDPLASGAAGRRCPTSLRAFPTHARTHPHTHPLRAFSFSG